MSPKLPSVSPSTIIKVLERKGFSQVRQSGSHVILKHSDGRRTTIPMHKGRDLGKGLLRHILRDAGLTVQDLSQ